MLSSPLGSPAGFPHRALLSGLWGVTSHLLGAVVGGSSPASLPWVLSDSVPSTFVPRPQALLLLALGSATWYHGPPFRDSRHLSLW